MLIVTLLESVVFADHEHLFLLEKSHNLLGFESEEVNTGFLNVSTDLIILNFLCLFHLRDFFRQFFKFSLFLAT